MTELVACFSSGEKSQNHVSKLVEAMDWSKIYIITNEKEKTQFKSAKNFEFVVVNFQKPVNELIEDLIIKLRGKFSGLEVALNLVSGNGKEHMAILSALLKLGVGIRLMALTKNGVEEL